MSKKTIIIFITVFVAVGIIILGIFLILNKKSIPTNSTSPWYQNFNPFGTGNSSTTGNNTNPDGTKNPDGTLKTSIETSRFYQITDFAVAGATFLEDTRPIEGADALIKDPIKTLISPDTEEGRKEIQTLLNETLSLKPLLVVDGKFGKSVTEAIKTFQTKNNLPTTGLIDTITAPYFTKTTSPTDANLYEQAPSVRYVERMNGHIYKMFLDTKVKEKISNSTIPSIYEAFFDKTAGTVIYRYLSGDKTINSFIATLGASEGIFLSQDISDLTTSKDKTKFFYLTKNSNGVTGTLETFGGTKKDIVFNSPFTEWLSAWNDNGEIFLTTKPSYNVNGSIYLLNTANKTISKIFGGIPGLTTTVNPKSSLVLYSTSTATGPKLGIFDIAKYSTKDLDTYGLAEKCVWSNDNVDIYCAVPNTIVGNQYPDYWYQGLISFDDYFVKINTTTGEKTTIANSINEIPIDGTNLFLDKTESTLFLINKKDSTFWSLDIE